MQKLLYLSTLILITLCFNGCFWGRGWLIPYSFQPSYHKFKKMCKLNELPNDEDKYNKILSYFDTDLDRLDWEELNKRKRRLTEKNFDYKKGVFEYITQMEWKELNSQIEMQAHFLNNKPEINRYNTNAMSFQVLWHTKRYYLTGNEGSGFYWSEIILGCSNDDNIIPRGEKNE